MTQTIHRDLAGEPAHEATHANDGGVAATVNRQRAIQSRLDDQDELAADSSESAAAVQAGARKQPVALPSPPST
ncbi:MAG: hypothetical protein RLZZ618_2442 [Pseudomonadota bacterium]|jgi:hypothetical protein